jgi:hypothetical protein
MAGFATYDDIISAISVNGRAEYREFLKGSMTTVAGNVYSRWQASGSPAAGTFGTSGTGRVIDNTFAAAIPFASATGGRFKHLLSAGLGSTVSLGTVLIYDRVVEYPFTGTTTSATFGTQPTPPARDLAGTTNGDGFMMFLESYSATATAAVTVTPTYTNSAGTGSRTNAFTSIATAALAGCIANPIGQMFLQLASGDVGVRTIQSYTLSASLLAANMAFVLGRPLAWVPLMGSNSYVERDLVLQLANLPRLYDGTAMGIALLANAATCPLNGRVVSAEN